MLFPFPCCQCGFCCLSETCPTGTHLFNIDKHKPCPALMFQGRKAVCVLALENPTNIGVGLGCCIKARAFANGKVFDFASLPPNVKIDLAQRKKGETHDNPRRPI